MFCCNSACQGSGSGSSSAWLTPGTLRNHQCGVGSSGQTPCWCDGRGYFLPVCTIMDCNPQFVLPISMIFPALSSASRYMQLPCASLWRRVCWYTQKQWEGWSNEDQAACWFEIRQELAWFGGLWGRRCSWVLLVEGFVATLLKEQVEEPEHNWK